MRDFVGQILGRPNLVLVNDNQPCLANFNSSPYKPENRHLDTKFHSIQEEIQHGSASMMYELTNSVLADELIKTLDRIKHAHFGDIDWLGEFKGSKSGGWNS